MLEVNDIRILKRTFATRSQVLKLEQDVVSIKHELKDVVRKGDLIKAKEEIKQDIRQETQLSMKWLEERLTQKMNDMKSEIIHELHGMIDPFVGEVVASREERLIVGYRLANNHDRLEKLEIKVFGRSLSSRKSEYKVA